MKNKMRMTGLWMLEAGAPVLKPELGFCEDEELKASLLAFLAGGSLALHSPGLRPDLLDRDRAEAVPVGYVTDGEWIWPLELSYYLEQHGVLPPQDFLEHARARGYRATVPTSEQLAAASEQLARIGGA